MRTKHKWGGLLKCVLDKQSGKMWNGIGWLRIGSSDGLAMTMNL
jgi:hypothetical protein